MYTMSSSPSQNRILAAARVLFDQDGAAGLSMRAIAKAVGVTPMAIYKHYADKDALLNALMLDGLAAWEARVAALPPAPPMAWLEKLGDAFLEFALTEPRRYEAAFVLRASAARQYPNDFAQGRSPVVSKILACIEEARARKEIGDDPTMDIAISFIALTQGLTDMYRAGRFVGETEFRGCYRKALLHCLHSFREKKPMTALICALLSGAMFYLSQGVDDVWWLAWLAPAPLLWLAYGDARRWTIFAAAVAAYACGQLYVQQIYGDAMPLFVVLLQLFGVGALFAGTMLLARAAWRNLSSAWVLAAFPAAWTAIEYGIGLISVHGSWGALGYSQVSFPPAIQVASLFGLYAVTFTLCVFANASAMAARGVWRPALPGFAFTALVLGFGWVHLGQSQGSLVRAAFLSNWDGSLRATRKLDFARSRALAQSYAAAARQEAGKGARIIVIPETALAADPAWREAAFAPLAQVAREKSLTLVAGVMLVKPWRNTAISFLADGSSRTYDKRHLLPPGENKFTPGHGPGPLGGGRSVAICKDLDFPRTVRRDAQPGIRLMAVPANDFVKDGWIHARMAVMRGVENGFAVVRTAFNGLDTVSDAHGRVLARASTVQPGMVRLSADVPIGPGPTLYTRIGDVFAWLCAALTLALAAMLLRKRPGQA